jgi:hypothetical protein
MKTNERKTNYSNLIYILLTVTVALILFNQYQIFALSSAVTGGTTGLFRSSTIAGGKDISSVDLSSIQGTGFSIAALFPVEDIKTQQDAVDMMIPTGTPDYGEQLGVSYDDPVRGLSILAGQVYPSMIQEIQNDQVAYQRYLDIVTKPVGISCEYCCGINSVGATTEGTSACGCQHNPALLGLTMWLVKNTDYTDAEIVREVLRWKALFFPKDMVELAMQVAGGDTSNLQLPGMVGGC